MCAQSIYMCCCRCTDAKQISWLSSRMSASAREDLSAYHPACLHLHEKISQRIIPHVCICTRRSLSVSSRMSGSAKKISQRILMYPPACVHLHEKISQRIIPHVCISKRRSPSVSSRMCASLREDHPAYHPACVHL